MSAVGDQPVDGRLALGALEFERQAALVAVEGGEEPGAEAAEPARVVALRRRLDLDHVGAKLGEDQPGGRTHDRMAEFEDPKPRQGSSRHQAILADGKARGGRDPVLRMQASFSLYFLGKSFALG